VIALDSENINIKAEHKIALFIVAVMETKHLSKPSTGMEYAFRLWKL
jgi:hypothetical protein